MIEGNVKLWSLANNSNNNNSIVECFGFIKISFSFSVSYFKATTYCYFNETKVNGI